MFNWDWDQTGIFRKLVMNESFGVLDLSVIRYLGFVHLVTESGIHLYALIGVSLAFWKAVAWGSGLPVRRSWLMGCAMGLGLCIAAGWLSGFRVGLVRPFVSIVARLLAQVFGFRFQWFGPLVIALSFDFIVLGEKSSQGRLHYALAVAGGLWIWNAYRHERFAHLKMAVVSWFGTAGLDLWECGYLSVFTPIWSLITIPVFASVCFPLILLAKLNVFYTETILKWMNEWMVTCLEIAFRFPGIVVISKERLLVAMLLGFFVCFVPLKWRLCLVALALICNGMLPESTFMIQKNVGQGDAFIMRDQGTVAMVDTGDEHQLRDSDWMRFFLSHQVTKLDQVLFTHLDSDHASGIKQIERLIPVDSCWVDSRHLVSKRSPCQFTPTTDPVSREGMRIATLSSGRTGKGNSVMTGVWIRNQNAEYLNLGDADERLEWRLYQRLSTSEFRSSQRILKLTHHGSRYSLSNRLLESYLPDAAWVSVSAKNRYGHPSLHAIALCNHYHIPVHRTDREGDISTRSLRAKVPK